MQLMVSNYWNIVINILMQKYFAELLTTCILWPQDFDFNLQSSPHNNTVWLQIDPLKLNESFQNNIYNFSQREEIDNKNMVYYSDLIKKLIAAIEHTHCEGFLVFQDDIPKFTQAFQKASIYSIWRSMNNRFLFIYSKDQQKENYFKDSFFKNNNSKRNFNFKTEHANILVVEAKFRNSTIFHLKTNKFVGPDSEHPEKLIRLSTFYGLNQTFVPDIDLFSTQKLENLQGREIVAGVFDYRPFVAVDYKRQPLYYDQAADNPSHLAHVDGTEIRICHTFCELYNCTLQFDTSEKEEWGIVYSNYTGIGLMGMIAEDKIEIAFGAIYILRSYYVLNDVSVYLSRTGCTCLVPAAEMLASWNLPLRPFEFTLWLSVLACLCLEIFILFAVRKFEQTMADQRKDWWSCFQFGCVTSLRLFINQGSNYLVQSVTVRTFLIACYMLDIILTSIYGGGLSAVLTLPTFGEVADTKEKLVKYNLTWTGTSYAWLETINGSESDKDPINRHLVNNFVANTIDDMREMAKTDNMAFIVERLSFGHVGGSDFFTPEALQRLKIMLDDVYSTFAVAMVSRLWPHTENFNNLLLKWHSSGLDEFWEWKSTATYLNNNEQKQVEASKYNNMDVGPTKLNTQNFAGSIVLWFVGMTLSVGVFIIEIVVYKWKGGEKQMLKIKNLLLTH